jgi:subtilisin-like proprotein convertase family protein
MAGGLPLRYQLLIVDDHNTNGGSTMAVYKYIVTWLGNSPIFDLATSSINLAMPHHIPTGIMPSITLIHMSILHTHLGDLDVTLTNPGGTSVKLFDDVGDSADGMINFEISDVSGTDIGAFGFTDGKIATNGNVNAQGGALLSALTATNMTGTWNLSIFDDWGQDTGQVLSWGLFIAFQYNGVVNGNAAPNTLSGSDDIDRINGFAGNDTMRGWLGNDVLIGGPGRDTMYGGPGRDIFDFNAVTESRVGVQRDTIADFSHVDDIDLRTIDAQTGPGNQAFRFIGTQAFSSTKGELRYSDQGAQCLVQGDTNGDGRADFEIMVKIPSMVPGDFLL